MKHYTFGLIAIGLFLATQLVDAAFESPPRQDIDGKISWIFDYEDGKAESSRTGKPMFVVFRCER